MTAAEHDRTRLVRVEALARVEGEGGLAVEVCDGEVTDVRLRIFEPPRLFEALLVGRDHTEVPDITARICGICPVAYQMSSCQAIEAACGTEVTGTVRDLRLLLYCGEWIESHALHVHLLHAPDFLGLPSGLAMAADHRLELERGLRLKQVGNELVELVGGRAIHPINVRVGGFHRAPDTDRVRSMLPALERAADDAEAVVDWVATLTVPEHRLPADAVLVALRHPDEYAVLGDRLVSTAGLDIGPDEVPEHIREVQAAHSTALHGLLHGAPYLVGPLARFVLNAEQLAPRAAAAARRARLDPSERNPFRSIVVRAVETLHACEVAIRIARTYERPPAPALTVTPRAGVGSGWSEAPRGTLWHRYSLAADGSITSARIMPPTSQNQPFIERDLATLVGRSLDLDDAALGAICAHAVRNYDPCISCATHALDVRIEHLPAGATILAAPGELRRRS